MLSTGLPAGRGNPSGGGHVRARSKPTSTRAAWRVGMTDGIGPVCSTTRVGLPSIGRRQQGIASYLSAWVREG